MTRRPPIPNGIRSRVDARLRNGIAEQAARGANKLEAEGMKRPPLSGPGTIRTRRSGYVLWRVRQFVDGQRRTREDAARTFAHQPWAKWAEGGWQSGGFYCWEVPEGKGCPG